MENFVPTPPLNPQQKTFSPLKMIFVLVPLLLIVAGGIFVWRSNLLPKNQTQNQEQKADTSKFTIQVGKEIIYKEIVDKQLALLPSATSSSEEKRKTAESLLIYQSQILQGAAEKKLVTLDSTIFNSENIDLNKRAAEVEKIQSQIDSQAVGTHGTVVYLWFNHPDSSITVDQAQQTTLNVMKDLQARVKNKEITIDQAAQLIKNNTELATVNSNYKDNSSFKFNLQNSPNVTFFPKFDAMLKTLKEGEVTNVYLAKESEYSVKDGVKRSNTDAVYMFGQVTKINTEKDATDFGTWIDQQIAKYEIKHY